MRDYIGIPYKARGRDREGLDCWGFVCLYHREQLGIELPTYEYGKGANEIAQTVAERLCEWAEDPEGTLILLRQFKVASHVGVVEGKHFYHCEEGTGVVRVPLDDPRWKSRIIGRYSYKGTAMVKVGPVPVVDCKTPKGIVSVSPSILMSRRETHEHNGGENLLGLVEKYIDAPWREFAHVTIHGQPIPPELWADVTVKAGAIVSIAVVPEGGNNSGMLRTILSIAVMAWAGAAGGKWVQGLLSVGKATGAAIAGALGLLVINALVPPPRVDLDDLSDVSQGNVYAINGAQNRISPYGAVPVVLGMHRMVPPYAAKPYTMLQGNDQYLCCLFAIGYGPLQISDLKIGDTAIASFSDVEYEIKEGAVGDTDITLFPESVSETVLAVELTYAGGYQTRATEVDTDEAIVDITFPRGLVIFRDNGKLRTTTVSLAIEYRETGGSGAWTTAVDEYVASLSLGSGGTGYASGSWPLVFTGGGGSGAAGTASVNSDGVVYKVFLTDNGEGYTSSPTVTIDEPDGGSGASITANIAEGVVFSARSVDPVRRGFRFAFPSRSQWDIRIKRATADATSSKTNDECSWTAIRSVKNEIPLDPPYYLAKVALRIKATGQLNGTIENFSCLVANKITSWQSGSGTWDPGLTSRNPADIYRHLLQGPFNKKAVADSRIDLDNLADWSEFCDLKGFTFDAILDTQATLAERLEAVASAGRASSTKINNNFAVVIEEAKTTPVQVFGPKNSSGFSASRTFIETPHAFRCRFINRDNDYLQEERIVYADGYNISNATLFQALSFFGVTDSDHVWKLARFHLAQMVYRQEVFNISVDYEHLVCTRGDLVLLRHDAPILGVSDGRVLSVSGADLTVDENCPMESGKTYAVTVRKSDGTLEEKAITLSIGDNTTITAATGSFTCATGDLFHFGETDLVNMECLVTTITPGPNLSAQLTLVPYSADVYTADSGSIPAYTSQASLPPDLVFPNAPTNIAANEYLYRESGLYLQGVSLLWSHSDNLTVDKYEVQMLSPDADAEWQAVGAPTLPTLDIKNIAAGIYSFRVRAWVGFKASDWLLLEDEDLSAQDDPPEDVSGIRLVYRSSVPYIVWESVTDVRDITYEVRVAKSATATWEEAVTLATQAITEWNPQVKGHYHVKAVAASGDAESESSASVFVPFSALDIINVKETNTEETDWDGTLSGGVFPAPEEVRSYDHWSYAKSGFDGNFDYEWDDTVKPDSDGWALVGADRATVSDGVLEIASGGSCYYSKSLTGLTGNQFLTVEAALKVEEGDSAMIFLNSGYFTTAAFIEFRYDGITIDAATVEVIACDMASGFRTIKIEFRSSIWVYLDGELLIVLDGKTGTAAGTGTMYFGRSAVGDTEAKQYWSKVNYAVDAFTADTSPNVGDGWSTYGSVGVSGAATNSDYARFLVTAFGQGGYEQALVNTDEAACLTLVADDIMTAMTVYTELVINNVTEGYGVSLSFEYYLGAFQWVVRDATRASVEEATGVTTNGGIFTLILKGDLYWFLINRTLVASGTAPAAWAALGDKVRWGGYNPVGGVLQTMDIASAPWKEENGRLCIMPGDTGTYTIESSVSLGYEAESIVDSDVNASVQSDTDLLLSPDLLLEADLLYPATLLAVLGDYVVTEISVDSDDWTALVPGGYYGDDTNLRLNLTAPEVEKLYISGWTWEVDMPDRVDKQTVTTLSTGDTSVTFDPIFQTSSLNIQVTIYDKQSGDHAEVTSVSASGFTLNVYNGGSRVIRDVYCLTQGY